MEKHRSYLLRFIFLGLCLTMTKLILFPPAEKNYTWPTLPKKLKTAQQTWQPSPLSQQNNAQQQLDQQGGSQRYDQVLVRQEYTSAKGTTGPMRMEISYVVRTQGDWHTFMEVKQLTLPDSPDAILDRSTPNGSYRLWQQGDITHLYSCIHRHRPTTVTLKQFRQNRYYYDLTADRFLSWFLGRVLLAEDTCLWLHLSRQEVDQSLDEAMDDMEPVWENITDWWRRF